MRELSALGHWQQQLCLSAERSLTVGFMSAYRLAFRVRVRKEV